MYRRNQESRILEALQDTPVILVNGSRQVGKSTFVRDLLGKTHHYITFDDASYLRIVRQDPSLFVEGLTQPVILDEIQRVPEIFLSIKKAVDEKRRPGHFVLTGSANVLALPRLGDSLAGRMEVNTLWPLSQGEIQGLKEDFIAILFGESFLPFGTSQGPSQELKNSSLEDLALRILKGGYPEVLDRKTDERRQKWFESYIQLLLEKDVRDLTNIEGLLEMPGLLKLLAHRCGTLLNTSELSRSLKIPLTTLKRYLVLLENLYLLVMLPAWSKNTTKKLVKAPKVFLNDSGLIMYFVGYEGNRLLKDTQFMGHVLENFVVMEFKKQITWSAIRCQAFHYRSYLGQEVDIVLESGDSRIVGIEVKLSMTVGPKDFSGLIELENESGESFHRGILLYMGDSIIPFGSNKYAVPLKYLWSLGK